MDTTPKSQRLWRANFNLTKIHIIAFFVVMLLYYFFNTSPTKREKQILFKLDEIIAASSQHTYIGSQRASHLRTAALIPQ